MIWQLWWVWIVGGIALGLIELVVTGYVFLGFAFGALVTGLLVWIGVAPQGIAGLLAIFALASLLGWAVLRRLAGVPRDPVRIWTRDINDN